jgi:EAL domain-containing protein (putative c-di-GMP-specific phosphodiesterase class I)
VDCLKIDRSFVSDLSSDEESERILQAILGFASALRLNTVAEGIETEAQLEILCRRGCQEGQGFLLARPLPVAAFEALLAESVAVGATGTSAAI